LLHALSLCHTGLLASAIVWLAVDAPSSMS
jgi:hypothetical protein